MKFGITIKNQEAIKEADEQMRLAIGLAIVQVYGELKQASPIDEGFFVNSWQARVNSRPALKEGHKGSRPGVEPEERDRIIKGVGKNIRLSNTAVYAEKLADGYSPQAPAGWVQSIVNRLQDHINKFLISARRR